MTNTTFRFHQLTVHTVFLHSTIALIVPFFIGTIICSLCCTEIIIQWSKPLIFGDLRDPKSSPMFEDNILAYFHRWFADLLVCLFILLTELGQWLCVNYAWCYGWIRHNFYPKVTRGHTRESKYNQLFFFKVLWHYARDMYLCSGVTYDGTASSMERW